MDFETIEDKLFFLRFALPSAKTLIDMGILTKKEVSKAMQSVSEGKIPEDHLDKKFGVAYISCINLSKEMKKNCIDSEVIERYALQRHNFLVENVPGFMGASAEACRAYEGEVIGISDESALIETCVGRDFYDTSLLKNIRVGDYVIVHRGYVVKNNNEC